MKITKKRFLNLGVEVVCIAEISSFQPLRNGRMAIYYKNKERIEIESEVVDFIKRLKSDEGFYIETEISEEKSACILEDS